MVVIAPVLKPTLNCVFPSCGNCAPGKGENGSSGVSETQLTELFTKANPGKGASDAFEMAKRFGGLGERRAKKECLTNGQITKLNAQVIEIAPHAEAVNDLFERLKKTEEARNKESSDGGSFLNSLAESFSQDEVDALLEAFPDGGDSEGEGASLRTIARGASSVLDLDEETFEKILTVTQKVGGVLKGALGSLLESETDLITNSVEFNRPDEGRHVLLIDSQLHRVSRCYYRCKQLCGKEALKSRNQETYKELSDAVKVDSSQQALFNRVVDNCNGSDLSLRYTEGRGMYSTLFAKRWEGQKELYPYWRGLHSFYTKYVFNEGGEVSSKEKTYIPESYKELVNNLEATPLEEVGVREVKSLKRLVLARSEEYKVNLLNFVTEEQLDYACVSLGIPYRNNNQDYLTEEDYMNLLKALVYKIDVSPLTKLKKSMDLTGGLLYKLFYPIKDLYRKLWFEHALEVSSTAPTGGSDTGSFLTSLTTQMNRSRTCLPKLTLHERQALEIVFASKKEELKKIKTAKSLQFLDSNSLKLVQSTLEYSSNSCVAGLKEECKTVVERCRQYQGMIDANDMLFHASCAIQQLDLDLIRALNFFTEADVEKIDQGIQTLKDYLPGIEQILNDLIGSSLDHEGLKARYELSYSIKPHVRAVLKQYNVNLISLLNLQGEAIDALYKVMPDKPKDVFESGSGSKSEKEKKIFVVWFFLERLLNTCRRSEGVWTEELMNACNYQESRNEVQLRFAKILSKISSEEKICKESIFDVAKNRASDAKHYTRALYSIREELRRKLQAKEELDELQVIEHKELETTFTSRTQKVGDFIYGTYPSVLRDSASFTDPDIELLFSYVERVSGELKSKMNQPAYWEEVQKGHEKQETFNSEEQKQIIDMAAARANVEYRHNLGTPIPFVTAKEYKEIKAFVGELCIEYTSLKKLYTILKSPLNRETNQALFTALEDEEHQSVAQSKTLSEMPGKLVEKLMRLTPLLRTQEVDPHETFTPERKEWVSGGSASDEDDDS